jgi:hypothetical protein
LRVIAPSTEDEMIAVFLRAGLDSPRFRERLKQALVAHSASPDLIRCAVTTEEPSNQLRRKILETFYGWGQDESVFGGMPGDVEWLWVELDVEDLLNRVFTIAWYFEETFGTRRAAELAELKRRTEGSLKNPILAEIRAGRFPESPILLSQPDLERMVILEGHNRIISYLVDPDMVPFPIRAILGVSSRISEWSEW